MKRSTEQKNNKYNKNLYFSSAVLFKNYQNILSKIANGFLEIVIFDFISPFSLKQINKTENHKVIYISRLIKSMIKTIHKNLNTKKSSMSLKHES